MNTKQLKTDQPTQPKKKGHTLLYIFLSIILLLLIIGGINAALGGNFFIVFLAIGQLFSSIFEALGNL